MSKQDEYICIDIDIRIVRVRASSREEAEYAARMSSFAIVFFSDPETRREWTITKCLRVPKH